MKLSLLALALALTIPAQAEDKWTPIFDGKTLDGWTPKFTKSDLGVNYNDTFAVEEGLLKVKYDKWTKFDGEFGHLFWKEKLSHYRLRVEVRFTGNQTPGGPGWATRNSGVMLHCQDPKTMSKTQEFPVSVEMQLLGGLGKGNRTTANMCSPGTNIVYNGKLYTPHTLNSKSKTYDGDQWVTVEVEVNGGGVIKHIIDGVTVLEYEQPQYDPKDKDAKPLIPASGDLIIKDGYIALQAESHPCAFRKVEIMKLEPKK